MATGTTTNSDYRSRQKRAGELMRQETRARLLTAAEEEFTANGYLGTTVSRLAAAAGVSVQTLYSTWGSKRALLRGYMELSLAGEASSPEDARERFEGLSPAERLDALADLVTEIAGRAATGWRLYRDASAADPEIAADWNELQLLRRNLIAHAFGDVLDDALAEGLSRDHAIDTAWTIVSPESYDLLVNRLGYSLDDFDDWMKRTLASALLEPNAA